MKILKTSSDNLKETINRAEIFLKQGKIIVCPTDTVYGLLADATNKKAVERLFKIKKRPKNKPIPIFVRDIKTAKQLARIDREKEKFLKKVWPGKVTVVLKRRKNGIKLYGVDKETVALRIPDCQPVNFLLERSKLPLTGTSANISGEPASTRIKDVIFQFKKSKLKPDIILDAGNLKPNKPSRVIDLTGKKPVVLRL